jgi:hypothetical protein
MIGSATARPSFNVVRRADYPRLAWLFDLEEGPTAHCGEDVEIFDNGLVEGCWDGLFSAFDFADRINFFGTGVVRRGGAWLFCPPCHTLEPLYAMVRQGRVSVSSSMVPLFAHAGVKPDLRVNYTRTLTTMTAGIDDAEILIWRDESLDLTLYRVLFDNFTVEGGGPPVRHRKVETASFPDFESYRRHLLGTIGALAANAADPARRRIYNRLVSTCSSGYDSPTVTALAAAAGCELVLSVRSARGGDDDSGRPIAEALGLACVERDREEAAAGGREIEWLTSGAGGGDYPLSVFEPELAGGVVLLTGFHGGEVWGRMTPPNGVLKHPEPTNTSVADFRRRVGFLHVPVPFIGALRDAEIHAISNSAEMRPYSVGGAYDRPICRRILEEAGIPRALVGQRKRAVATHFSRDMRLISPETRASFEADLLAQGTLRDVRRDLLAFQAARFVFRVVRKAVKVAPILEWPLGWIRDGLDGRFRARENSRYASLLFVWAVGRSLAAYAPAGQDHAREGHTAVPPSGAASLVDARDLSGPASLSLSADPQGAARTTLTAER